MMKKKIYIQPQLEVIKISSQQMLCGSITQDGNNLNVTFDDSEFENDATINSRGFDFWGEED